MSRIDAEKARPSLFTQPQPTPVSPPIFETYAPFYTPSRPQQPVYNQFFGFSHLQPTPQPSSPKKARSKEIQKGWLSWSEENNNLMTHQMPPLTLSLMWVFVLLLGAGFGLWILRLEASAEHTQFRNFEVSVSFL